MLFCHSADPCIALLGAMQAMFEAAMYSFVFLWTPALSPNGEAIKHGLIFRNLMTACMAGSYLSGAEERIEVALAKDVKMPSARNLVSD